jgi:hypothetical protein
VIPLADPSFTLPKIPLKQNVVVNPPPVQIEMAEIVEQADAIVLEKIEDGKWEDEPLKERPVIELNPANLGLAMAAFAEKLNPSASALIRMFQPVIAGNEVKVSMNKANINLTDGIKVEWQRFLREYFNSRDLILTIIEDESVVKNKVAYTQREQLDELVKEYPLVKDLLKKLNLKLK